MDALTLDALVVRCFDRACFAVEGSMAAPEEQHPGIALALMSIGEMVQRGSPPGLDRVLFTEQVRKASEQSPVPYRRGAFLGTLAEWMAQIIRG